MAMSKRRRFDVFKRDLFQCQYCGRQPPDVMLECDHVIPRSKGGSGESDNLVTSCFDCNRGKSDRELDARSPDIIRVEMVEQMAALNEAILKQQTTLDRQLSKLSRYLCKAFGWNEKYFKTSTEWRSLKIFFGKLPVDEIIQAVDTCAARRSPRGGQSVNDAGWRYFCGICWTKIRNRGTME